MLGGESGLARVVVTAVMCVCSLPVGPKCEKCAEDGGGSGVGKRGSRLCCPPPGVRCFEFVFLCLLLLRHQVKRHGYQAVVEAG